MDCCYRILRFLNAQRLNIAIPIDGVKLTDQEARALTRIVAMFWEPSRLCSPRVFVSSNLDTQETKNFRTRL